MKSSFRVELLADGLHVVDELFPRLAKDWIMSVEEVPALIEQLEAAMREMRRANMALAGAR